MMDGFIIFSFVIFLSALFAFIVIWLIEFIFLPSHNFKVDRRNYEMLIRGIKQHTIDEEGVSLIFRKRNDDRVSLLFVQQFSYERFLDSFLYYVRDHDEDGTLITEVYAVVKPIIDKIKEENPFSNVNEKERRILLSINDTMKKSDNLADSEKSAIKHNLDDLAMALEKNQEELKKSKKSNKITWLSIIITVLFGIISMIPSIIAYFKN